MPNGGSDCCGTCWFNARNKGEVGYGHARDPEPNFCTIRKLPIANPFWTYCANHPHHSLDRDPVPIGPVFIADGGFPYHRKPLHASPDTEEVRQHLFELLQAMEEEPKEEYPAGAYVNEAVVWQLGEFRERRALADLRRISSFLPEATAGRFQRTRRTLVAAAHEALAKIEAQRGP
jgi:hypothetical protein